MYVQSEKKPMIGKIYLTFIVRICTLRISLLERFNFVFYLLLKINNFVVNFSKSFQFLNTQKWMGRIGIQCFISSSSVSTLITALLGPVIVRYRMCHGFRLL